MAERVRGAHVTMQVFGAARVDPCKEAITAYDEYLRKKKGTPF